MLKMKRLLAVSPAILCGFSVFFPLGRTIGILFGYDFILRNDSVFLAVLAVLSGTAAMLLFWNRSPVSRTQAVFSALLPLCSAVNGLFFLLDSSSRRTTVLGVLVCYACSVAILAKAVLRPAWKIASTLLSAVLTGILLFSSFLSLVFGDLGVKTVVSSAPSPQKTFTAEVIDSNQGALGGSTLVLIRSNNAAGADLLLCKFSKAPVCVYTGHWGEFQTMKLAWKDERTLIINGMEYAVA